MCIRDRSVPATHQTISGYVQKIRLCHTNTISCLYFQSLQQHYWESHVCGVNMADDALFSSSSRRLPHRRVGANAHRMVELGQTCSVCAFHLPRCRGVLRCVRRQQSMRQRAYHHERSNRRRSPGMYARRTGCSSWGGVIAAARVNMCQNRVFPQKLSLIHISEPTRPY